MKTIIVALFVLSFGGLVVYSQVSNERQNTLNQTMRAAGYAKIRIVNNLNMDFWRDSLFVCIPGYSQTHAEAEKNGSRRKVVICNNETSLSMYDGEENPPFPLLVTQDSALEVYANFGNSTAALSIEDEQIREVYRENEME